MPYSPSPDRHNDRRGPPRDWDAPEEEEGEISYSGRHGSSSRGRDSRGRGGYSDRRRDDRYRDGGGSDRRDYRDRDRSERDYRDRDRDKDRSDRDGGRRRRSSRSRSRSRSPNVRRGGGRSRSRSPKSKRGGYKDDADKDREYKRRRDDGHDSGDDGKKSINKKGSDKKSSSAKEVDDEEMPMEELSPEDEEARMMALMGFGGFDSTKGKKVAGADVSGSDIKKQRQYRQYMNRRGGFNRPLDAK